MISGSHSQSGVGDLSIRIFKALRVTLICNQGEICTTLQVTTQFSTSLHSVESRICVTSSFLCTSSNRLQTRREVIDPCTYLMSSPSLNCVTLSSLFWVYTVLTLLLTITSVPDSDPAPAMPAACLGFSPWQGPSIITFVSISFA